LAEGRVLFQNVVLVEEHCLELLWVGWVPAVTSLLSKSADLADLAGVN